MLRNEQDAARASYGVETTARPLGSIWATLGLIAGDLLVFGLFVAIGRRSHSAGAPLGEIVTVAAPFAIGWLAVAPWAGLYSRAAGTMAAPRVVLRRTALAWLLACPIGLLLRSVVWKHEFKPAFAITTFLFNLGLLLLWRAGACWAAARLRGRR